MGRNTMINDTQITEFAKKYIPKELNWRPTRADENPFVGEYKLGPYDYTIHISFFKEVGLRLPCLLL